MRARIALLAALVPMAGTLEAGPWALGAGHTYAKVGYGRLVSETLVSPDGTRLPIPTFTKDEISLYVAHGLGPRVTVSATLLWLNPAVTETGFSEQGVGDTQVGVQVQVGRHGAWVHGLRATLQAPTGDETKAMGVLPTGSGAWEGLAAYGVGRSLARGKGWAFVDFGYHARGAALRDNFAYDGQLGWHVGARVALAANVRGIEPFDSSGQVARGSPVGLSDGASWTIVGPSAMFEIGTSTLQVDLDIPVRASNLAEGTTLRIGIAVSR